MNGSAKRLMAVMLASVMIASAMVVVLVDEQDSSADVDPTNYYYSQLDMEFCQDVYNEVISVTTFTDLEITIDVVDEDERAQMIANEGTTYLSGLINKGIIAAIYDNPLVGYYIHSTYPTEEPITHTSGYTSVTFTLNKVDPTSPGLEKSVYDSNMTDAINSFYTSGTVSPSDSISTKIKKIHDYVATTLTYSSSGDGTIIRSVYTTLCGDHNVVCEGYAKMFKVLCDKFDIPCLIVTGTAGPEGDRDNHMWNYVMADDMWYLVDCTWDDQAELLDDYLMAGTSTEAEHFGNATIAESYNPSGLDNGLRVYEKDAPLSSTKYGSLDPQYLVTFLLDPVSSPGTIYSKQYVKSGDTVSLPEDPADKMGYHFFGWYVHDSDTEFNFATEVITSDTTIDGKWTTTEVYTLKYDTDGGTVIQATRVEADDNTTKITVTEPKKEGFKFKEWNTAKDGKGMSYKGGEEITLVGDCTLYAIWEDTSSVTFKIDNTINKAAEFLSKETIPGVSNLLLTIGVITTVVSLLAVLAIARK